MEQGIFWDSDFGTIEYGWLLLVCADYVLGSELTSFMSFQIYKLVADS